MKEYYVKVEGGDTNKPFNCEICNKDFDMKRDLKEHLARIHCDKSPDQKTIECVQCGAHWCKTGKYVMYYRHITSHGPNHNEQCAQCTRKFLTFKEHENHVKTGLYFLFTSGPKFIHTRGTSIRMSTMEPKLFGIQI